MAVPLGAPTRGRTLLRSMSQLLDRVGELDVLVLGDAVLDCWAYGHARRLGREGPVPVVEVDREEESPGGAANLAANAAALGARVRFAGIVGDDRAGDQLLDCLRGRGVDVTLAVRDATRATVTKHRVACDGAVTARFDRNAGGDWSRAARDELVGRTVDQLERADLVLVADYGMGTLGSAVREAIATRRDRMRGPLVVDGHHFADWAGCRPTAVTPNAEETGQLLGHPLPASDRPRAVVEEGQVLIAGSGADMVLATLDGDGGVLLSRHGEPYPTPGIPAPPQHTCGAGDALTATFGLALAAGLRTEAAVDLSSAAAASVVDRVGTCCCTPEGILRPLARMRHAGVLTAGELTLLVSAHRRAGGRIVFTNGCFDVLHLGHVRYLQEARALGDMLVVAVNSDESVTRLKGEGRPVITDSERAGLLAALEAVDAVTVFPEDSPRALIEAVRPDLYVKGGDYTASMLPETELVERLGGRVVTVGYLPDHSTTELLERIQADRAGSAEGAG